MITPFDIYLISMADGFAVFLLLLAIICAGIPFILAKANIGYEEDEGDESSRPVIIKYMKWFWSLSFIFLVGAMIIPSTKTLTAMYVIPKIANSQLVQNIPGYLQDFIRKELNNNGDNAQDGQ